ncbi:MAG: DNA-protecting protein DprA [SAR324 cluster bacterium]|nr:DNA-protecting protein DprA [SAR324 cluster bacterium]
MPEGFIVDLLRLWLIPNLGIKSLNQIIKLSKSPAEISDIFKLSASDLKNKYRLTPKIVHLITNNSSRKIIDQELELLEQHQVKLISVLDENYPALLKHIHNPPPILYYKGNIEFDYTHSVSVVGTRMASFYGVNHTRKIIDRLKELDSELNIVSGLARGIDSVAHEQALKNNLTTYAVLGNGLSFIYPKQNIFLAEQILEQDGGIISEVPLTSPPLTKNFPLRNRIISGLTPASMIMEASTRSGSLITARYALEQNREVFVLPGPVGQKNYEGSLQLIKRNVANLLTSADDVIESLSLKFHRPLANHTQISNPTHSPRPKIDAPHFDSPPSATKSVTKIVDKQPKIITKVITKVITNTVTKAITKLDNEGQLNVFNQLQKGEATLESLCDCINLESSVILATLTELEMKGLLTSNLDGFYMISDEIIY